MHRRRLAQLAYVGLSVADTALASRPGTAAHRGRHLTKPLLMPALAAAAHQGAGSRRDALISGTQVAQGFSWAGDVALLGTSTPSFLTGMGSFFAAHVAYIAAFTSAREGTATLTSPGPKAAAATWLLAAPLMATAAGRKEPSLHAPVAAYTGILCAMFASSTTLRRSIPTAARRRIVAGTSLFLLSDTLLGIREFLRDDDSRTLDALVMATYTAGQLLIAEGSVAAR
jgi:uncharacterized membrane protein YhhN